MANAEQRRGIFLIRVPTQERPSSAPVREAEVRPAPAPEPERRLKQRREKPFSKRKLAVRLGLALAAIAIASGIQHHIQEGEPLSPSGIMADVKGILPTAEKNIDNLAEIVNLNIHLEPEVAPYNPDSTKPQEIKAGPNGNAQAITPEAIREFIDRKPPILKPAEERLFGGTIHVIFPVNPENANNVKVAKTINVGKFGTGFYQDFYVRGRDVPFYLPVLEGAQKVKARAAVTWGLSVIFLYYYLNNGQVVSAQLNFSDNNFTQTEELKKIPTYDPNIVKTSETVAALPTKEFDLRKNPSVTLFNVSGSSRITFEASLRPTLRSAFLLDSFFLGNDDENLLYQSPSSSEK